MDQDQITSHVVDFFSSLLSAKPESGFSIAPSLWDASGRITSEENEALLTPLSEDKILEIIRSANPTSASGPDGFSIPYFRKFWPQLRDLICAIIQGFCLGMVDILRLNYAVITPIPKVKGADIISQFRPIALINNFAKFPSQGFATRLSPVTHRALSPY